MKLSRAINKLIESGNFATIMLRIAAIATLFALALMVWSVVQPDVVPIMIAMSLGQLLGTLAFAAYGLVVFLDITRKRRERRMSQDLTAAAKAAREISDAKHAAEAASAPAEEPATGAKVSAELAAEEEP